MKKYTDAQLSTLDNLKCPWKGTHVPTEELKAKCLQLLAVQKPQANSKRSEIRSNIEDYMNGKIIFPFTKEDINIFFFTKEQYAFAGARARKQREEEE